MLARMLSQSLDLFRSVKITFGETASRQKTSHTITNHNKKKSMSVGRKFL